jgi:ribosomal-protein-alanine N-acetyltransferase
VTWESLPTITTKRLSLRWIREDDLNSLYEIFSNAEVMRYWSTPPLTDKAAAAELLAEIHHSFRIKQFMKWGVALAANDSLVGTVTIFNLDLTHRRAEIGYALRRDQWGKGFMNEALNALLSYAFNNLQLHRLEADVDPRNVNSIRTLEHLGFRREGYLRERWQVNGEIQDALFYGLLRPEWQSTSMERSEAM